MSAQYFIGMMSGTSMDAIDAAVFAFSAHQKIEMLATHSTPIPPSLKKELVSLCSPGENAIFRMGTADRWLGECFANCAKTVLKKNGIPLGKIAAIGTHGQTIRHMPSGDFPFTVQIGDPNTIATLTGITTIADFRRRDMALGGQGAPLAPSFHNFLFRDNKKNRVIVNIGGIANITFLPCDTNKKVTGFDTGPGNTLMDAWCAKHLNQDFDQGGAWAASGEVDNALLQHLLNDAYFKKAHPKSTGREYFNLDWLQSHLPINNKPADIQATLLELTAQSISQTIHDQTDIFICGGGAQNTSLLKRLTELNKGAVTSTEALGLHPQWVEAATFAWLAKQTLANKPGNLPSVTGAQKPCVLGAIYR